jgi:PTS system D-glucosamine-specific IIC component/PTS system maltose and glucose-specific IIC component
MKKNNFFGTLQKIGRSFMLPIAVLPIAGLLLGIGSTFTGSNFHDVIAPDSIPFKILSLLADCGNIVFGILPVLFAVAVAIGLAKNNKEVAGLSALIAYFVMNMAIVSTVKYFMDVESLMETQGLLTNMLGFENTMSTGVLGGVVIGFVVSILHNKFQNVKLPDMLSFFGGTHFVPIISACTAILVGILFAIFWPFLAMGIAWLGETIAKLGYVGSFLYGFILRALIPTGLHHVFYMPFWQTSLGGTAEVAGTFLEGAQNILFAQLQNGDVISASVAKFYSGNYPIMMFGFPAAALAMYHTAKKENRAKVKGLLFSSSLASFLTGITEPLEFSFLFASPFLFFGIHCVLGGLSFALVNILGAGVGYTFSAGLLDFIIYGVIPGNERTSWLMVLLVGVIYAFVYYFTFRFFITKFNIKTPGRENNVEDVKLHSKAEYLESKNSNNMNEKIVIGLGGMENIIDVDNCATRLRVSLTSADKIDENLLKETGAAGVFKKGDNVQVIYGPQVVNIKNDLDEYMQSKSKE